MGIDFIDNTGKPRSDEELQEAIDCINLVVVKYPFTIPQLTLNAGVIRDGLRELQGIRAIVKRLKYQSISPPESEVKPE